MSRVTDEMEGGKVRQKGRALKLLCEWNTSKQARGTLTSITESIGAGYGYTVWRWNRARAKVATAFSAAGSRESTYEESLVGGARGRRSKSMLFDAHEDPRPFTRSIIRSR